LGLAPSDQSGKVDGPLVIPGSLGAFDPAKLALKTKIHDFLNVFGLEFFGIDLGIFFVRAISVDGVEEFRKAAAVSDTQTAIGTKAKNAFSLRAQVFSVVITRIGRVISGIVAHRATPLI
jgi:hypothetical protein